MSRIGKKFAALKDETAFVGFITAGDPTPAHTVKSMHALVAGGTDIIELGVPFSGDEDDQVELLRELVKAGHKVSSFYQESASMEEVLINLSSAAAKQESADGS